jgi:hypothetical protein
MHTPAAATDTDHHIAWNGALDILSDVAAARSDATAVANGQHRVAHNTAAAADNDERRSSNMQRADGAIATAVQGQNTAAYSYAAAAAAAAAAATTGATTAATTADVRRRGTMQRVDGVAAATVGNGAANTAATQVQSTAAYSNAAAATAAAATDVRTRSAMQQGDGVPAMLINNRDAWQQGSSSTVTTRTGSFSSGDVARSSIVINKFIAFNQWYCC